MSAQDMHRDLEMSGYQKEPASDMASVINAIRIIKRFWINSRTMRLHHQRLHERIVFEAKLRTGLFRLGLQVFIFCFLVQVLPLQSSLLDLSKHARASVLTMSPCMVRRLRHGCIVDAFLCMAGLVAISESRRKRRRVHRNRGCFRTRCPSGMLLTTARPFVCVPLSTVALPPYDPYNLPNSAARIFCQ